MQPELTQFIRENHEMLKEVGKEWVETKNSFFNFIDTHTKQPILTTEDGVEIIDNTCFIYSINTSRWSTVERYADFEYRQDMEWKHFSTETARTSYIIQNKPLTSVKEQVEAITALEDEEFFHLLSNAQIDAITEVLTELAKSKVG